MLDAFAILVLAYQPNVLEMVLAYECLPQLLPLHDPFEQCWANYTLEIDKKYSSITMDILWMECAICLPVLTSRNK